jgi:hypothetical protein
MEPTVKKLYDVFNALKDEGFTWMILTSRGQESSIPDEGESTKASIPYDIDRIAECGYLTESD